MDNPFTGKISTTGIGSLPFTDPDRAVKFVFECGLDTPFWPQLPQRHPTEKMIPQFSANMPCVRWDTEKQDAVLDISDKYGELEHFYAKYLTEDAAEFELDDESAPAFFAFCNALSEKSESGTLPAALKGQVTGPLTFSTGISGAEGKTLYADTELRDAAVKMLSRNACRQAAMLKNLGVENVIIFADEPVLSAYGSSSYVGISEDDVINMLSAVFTELSANGAFSGLHVCGNSDWGMAMRSGVDVLNFDAYQYGATLALYSSDLRRFLDDQGVIAWGIVPTTDAVINETPDSLTERFNESINALEAKGFKREELLQHSILTPSCGAGSLDEKLTAKVFNLLEELKNSLQDDI